MKQTVWYDVIHCPLRYGWPYTARTFVALLWRSTYDVAATNLDTKMHAYIITLWYKYLVLIVIIPKNVTG